MTKPRKRPQQSLDNRADYDAQRRTFEGASDIKTAPTSEAYRVGYDRVTWNRITGTTMQGVSKMKGRA